MNGHELAANTAATSSSCTTSTPRPSCPFDHARFDAVTCCVSVDYLVQPIAVFAEA